MAVVITCSPAEPQVDQSATITITGLTGNTNYIVQTWQDQAPVVDAGIGGMSLAGFGGGHMIQRLTDVSGNLTVVRTPQQPGPFNVAVFALPVQQGATTVFNCVSGE